VDDRAVLLAVPPDSGLLHTFAVRVEGSQQTGNVLGRPDILDGHAEEFLAGVAVAMNGDFVDFEEAEGFQVVDPHGVGVFLEEQTIALCRRRNL